MLGNILGNKTLADTPSIPFIRLFSQNILRGANRDILLSRLGNFYRVMSESILRGASRVISVVRSCRMTRRVTQGILRGASRLIALTLGRFWNYKPPDNSTWKRDDMSTDIWTRDVLDK